MTSTVKNVPANVKVSRVIPEAIVGKVMFWTSLPAALLLITIGIAFFNPCVWSYYLPFVAFGSLLACVRWRTTGLVGSYLILISLLVLFSSRIPGEMKLWQMGVLFTLALDFFISLLAIEEIASLLHNFIHQAQDQLSQLHQSELKLIQLEQSQREEVEHLQEEIQQLKEETEQRRIEKHQNAKQLEYFESEIQMLTAQKGELISDTFTARALANERLHELEEIKKNFQVSENEGLKSEISRLNQEIDSLKQEFEEKSKHLHESLNIKTQETESLNQKLLAVSSLSGELDKKSRENETLTEEFQDKLTAKSREIEELKEQLRGVHSLRKEIEVKNQEVANLTRQLETVKYEELPVKEVDPEEALELKRQLAQVDGLYKQLRLQFEEKANVLSQTRKDLFQTQGKLLALEHQHQLEELDPDRALEKEIVKLGTVVDELEGEITLLEELISHNQSR